MIFSLITCHLRSQPEGVPPPLSPVNTLQALKNLYSPLLLRLLSRTLAGGLSSAWGSAGGGADGRVAVRAAQWETQWEATDPEVEAEAVARPLDKIPPPLSSPLPESIQQYTNKMKSSRHAPYSMHIKDNNHNSKSLALKHKHILPSPLDEGSSGNEALVTMLNSRPCRSYANTNHNSRDRDLPREGTMVTLSHIVMIAADQIRKRRHGSLADAIRTSPHRLIQQVVAAQKSHLSGAK